MLIGENVYRLRYVSTRRFLRNRKYFNENVEFFFSTDKKDNTRQFT